MRVPGKIGGGEEEGEMEEMLLCFRWRLRREERDVRGAREERVVRLLNSRLREVRDESRGEEEGIGDNEEIWLLLARRVVRSGKAEAMVTISDQDRRVSSNASSRIPLKEVEADAERSEDEMEVKRLPLEGLAT